MEDVSKVEELVEERADAKARRDYAAADAIRDQLNAMGISVDDRSREWRVADAPYARARGEMARERELIRDGYKRAKNASWLPGADWESLLERPLDEVRQTLGVVPADGYPVLRSEGAPALA